MFCHSCDAVCPVPSNNPTHLEVVYESHMRVIVGSRAQVNTGSAVVNRASEPNQGFSRFAIQNPGFRLFSLKF